MGLATLRQQPFRDEIYQAAVKRGQIVEQFYPVFS
ncbi:hypothetical protein NITMOv2_0129 [Nitrospira moscoviensis]|uniref:Uncharacterized protein n=1 Tax=Nitrospira moscoviensis TaxID=42253 RepID=A0A0K2G6T6_NITMO|nr:hypothetical protein NITMOv2_0129 [Nitrospira moscoviensis]